MNTDHRDDIIAMVQESDRWSRQIGAIMEKWNQLNASRDESSTDEDFHNAPKSSPTLPVEETESTIEPSSNSSLLLADEDGPQTDATVDIKPAKQDKEPREESVPPKQTITGTEEEPREDTSADATIEANTLLVPTNGGRGIGEEEIQVADQANPKQVWTDWVQATRMNPLNGSKVGKHKYLLPLNNMPTQGYGTQPPPEYGWGYKPYQC